MQTSFVVNVPTPGEPDRYPVSDWQRQNAKYHEYQEHFAGDWLAETDQSDQEAPKYPLRLNPFRMACLLHAAFLFGEVSDSSEPLVNAVIEPWGQNSKAQERDLASRMADFVNRTWYENDGRSIQQEAGIISQIMGGCVFGLAADPDIETGVRIDHVLPQYFFPVWAPNRYSMLVEAFVSFQINGAQAEALYGVSPSNNFSVYHEHWTRDRYEITVDGSVINWAGLLMQGRPVGGFVPYTYIPHIRVGEFYGESLLYNKLQLAQEVNNVYADVGDIVSENARALPVVRNTQKIQERRLDCGVTYIDIGKGLPGFGDPDIKFPTSVQANAPTVSWASELLTLARIEVYTPPVVYGLDEGSQRSALTLAFRMIPLIVHIRQERTNWTAGLNQLAQRILRIAAEKNLEPGITRESIRRVKIWQDWAPILPRDREQEVNEIIIRVNAGLMSPQTALERLADIRDVKTELNLIKAWMEYQAQVNAPSVNDPFGGSSTNGELAGLKKPKQPQATTSKEE